MPASDCPIELSACSVVISPTSSASQPKKPKRNDNDEIWLCHHCNEVWDYEDDNRWIVCDICDEKYHLQCSGLQYEASEYYEKDLEDENFYCDDCDA